MERGLKHYESYIKHLEPNDQTAEACRNGLMMTFIFTHGAALKFIVKLCQIDSKEDFSSKPLDDAMSYAQKKQWISSLGLWQEFRKIRNSCAHHYDEIYFTSVSFQVTRNLYDELSKHIPIMEKYASPLKADG